MNVTNVNDNAPQFDDGPSLELSVAEYTPMGHTVWSLSAHDDDDDDVSDNDGDGASGGLIFQLESASVEGVVEVREAGQVVLAASPDYLAYEQVG